MLNTGGNPGAARGSALPSAPAYRCYTTQYLPTPQRPARAGQRLDAGADGAFVQDRWGHATLQQTILSMRYTTVTRDAQTRPRLASPRLG